MCGRIELDWQNAHPALRRLAELTRLRYPDYPCVAGEFRPGDLLPLLRQDADGPAVELMRWGFPQATGKGLVINARAETAALKPLFRDSLRSRRCLLPVTGFYEWAKDADHTKYLLRPEAHEVFYLAALYQAFEGETRFVILTQEANSSLADIHHRMPLIIAPALVRRWLGDSEAARGLLLAAGPQLNRTPLPRG